MSAFSRQVLSRLKIAIPMEVKGNGTRQADRAVRIGAGNEATGNYFESDVGKN
jgi:hypothetical protein